MRPREVVASTAIMGGACQRHTHRGRAVTVSMDIQYNTGKFTGHDLPDLARVGSTGF